MSHLSPINGSNKRLHIRWNIKIFLRSLFQYQIAKADVLYKTGRSQGLMYLCNNEKLTLFIMLALASQLTLCSNSGVTSLVIRITCMNKFKAVPNWIQ